MNAGKLAASTALATAVVAWSCAPGTQLHDVRLESVPHPGKLRRVTTVGLTANRDLRFAFERDLAAKIEQRGATAVPSSAVFPGGELPPTQQDARAALERARMDGVLVARLTSEDIREGRVGKAALFFGPFYSASYGAPVAAKEPTVVVEVSLFQVSGDERLLWSACSKAMDPGMALEAIAAIDDAVSAELARDGLI
ncbi:MAG TPA: hypothetical protein VMK12_03740 [Anaeromyxobacteraceae bacterium]|nr:hypothetical protein [Anaeromyxobacteraceae bacterium]